MLIRQGAPSVYITKTDEDTADATPMVGADAALLEILVYKGAVFL